MKGLIKKVLKENTQENFNLSWNTFSDKQRSIIEERGREVFEDFKHHHNVLNELLKQKSIDIDLRIPNSDFIKKNLDDIEWVLNGPGSNIEYWSSKKRKELTNSKEQLIDGNLILFHEGDEWSLINLFDNNIKLWIQTINNTLNYDKSFERYTLIKEKIDPDLILDIFFNKRKRGTQFTYAQLGFLDNITTRLSHSTEIVKGTSEKGFNVENEFYKIVIKRFGEDNVKVFSSRGGIIDMTGVDMCLNEDGIWKPVQIKTTKQEARKNIPVGGFSAWPKGTDDNGNTIFGILSHRESEY